MHSAGLFHCYLKKQFFIKTSCQNCTGIITSGETLHLHNAPCTAPLGAVLLRAGNALPWKRASMRLGDRSRTSWSINHLQTDFITSFFSSHKLNHQSGYWMGRNLDKFLQDPACCVASLPWPWEAPWPILSIGPFREMGCAGERGPQALSCSRTEDRNLPTSTFRHLTVQCERKNKLRLQRELGSLCRETRRQAHPRLRRNGRLFWKHPLKITSLDAGPALGFFFFVSDIVFIAEKKPWLESQDYI